MSKLFSERYKELLSGNQNFLLDEWPLISKFASIINSFDEESITHPDRFNLTLVGKESALVASVTEYHERNGWYQDDIKQTIDSLDESSMSRLFDISELLYINLTSNFKTDFEKEINKLFIKYDNPWRLFDGRFLKIDTSQFNKDLQNKAAEELQEISIIESPFSIPYKDYIDAIEALNQGKYNNATFLAAKSLESTLKITVGLKGKYKAKEALSNYANCANFPMLPEIMNPQGFCDNVLGSVFYIRNNSSAAHGLGDNDSDISQSLARLTIDLAAAIHTFIIEVKMQKRLENINPDDLPF